MRIKLRLYRFHDNDIIAILRNSNSFSEIVTKAITAFLNGEELNIQVPNDKNIFSAGYNTQKVQCVNIYISDKNHSDVVELLNSIKKDQQNAFIKLLLRRYVFLSFAENITGRSLQFKNNLPGKELSAEDVVLGNAQTEIPIPVSDHNFKQESEEDIQENSQDDSDDIFELAQLFGELTHN